MADSAVWGSFSNDTVDESEIPVCVARKPRSNEYEYGRRRKLTKDEWASYLANNYNWRQIRSRGLQRAMTMAEDRLLWKQAELDRQLLAARVRHWRGS
jgi:hypothetical protein